MGQLTREDLLKRQNLKIEKVDLGDEEFVYVREMTGHDRDAFENSIVKQKFDNKGKYVGVEQMNEDFRAKLAVVTICDEKGDLLLEPREYLQFSKSISITKLEKIVKAASELNKITEKDKEDLVKNSEAAQADNSSSDSVVN
jgi:hypothetical protein